MKGKIMPFTNPDFPNQIFDTIQQLEEAYKKRKEIETELAVRAEESNQITHVTATVIPAPSSLLERRILELESRLEEITNQLQEKSGVLKTNKDNLPIGMILKGESKGQSYTLEITEDGYFTSTGEIADTLSQAAEIVSGNRRSGWAFWKDGRGTPIGNITGRFSKHGLTDPFGAFEMS